MLISDSTARALDNIAARERDVIQTLAPFPDLQSDDPAPATLPPDTYFVTRTNSGERSFTRAGSFSFRDGTLIDGSGLSVLGYRSQGSALEPLAIDPIDLALGLPQDPKIQADGTVTYGRNTIDPQSGARELQRITLGRLATARFPAGTRLSSLDEAHVGAPPGISPHIGAPGDGTFAPLEAGLRVRGAYELESGLQRLQEAYLALDALRAAGAAQGGLQKTAMDLLT